MIPERDKRGDALFTIAVGVLIATAVGLFAYWPSTPRESSLATPAQQTETAQPVLRPP